MSTVLPLARLLSRPRARAGRRSPFPSSRSPSPPRCCSSSRAVRACSWWIREPGPRAGSTASWPCSLWCCSPCPSSPSGAAAARLTSRRRNDRLATLRLLGASTRELWSLTVFEATAIAAAGAATGVPLYAVLLPAVGLLPFFGGPVGVGAVIVDPLLGAGVLASVVLIGAVSAAASLRKVAVTPLGVRTRSEAPAKKTTAFVVGAVLIAGSWPSWRTSAPWPPMLGPAVTIAVLSACSPEPSPCSISSARRSWRPAVAPWPATRDRRPASSRAESSPPTPDPRGAGSRAWRWCRSSRSSPVRSRDRRHRR